MAYPCEQAGDFRRQTGYYCNCPVCLEAERLADIEYAEHIVKPREERRAALVAGINRYWQDTSHEDKRLVVATVILPEDNDAVND